MHTFVYIYIYKQIKNTLVYISKYIAPHIALVFATLNNGNFVALNCSADNGAGSKYDWLARGKY